MKKPRKINWKLVFAWFIPALFGPAFARLAWTYLERLGTWVGGHVGLRPSLHLEGISRVDDNATTFWCLYAAGILAWWLLHNLLGWTKERDVFREKLGRYFVLPAFVGPVVGMLIWWLFPYVWSLIDAFFGAISSFLHVGGLWRTIAHLLEWCSERIVALFDAVWRLLWTVIAPPVGHFLKWLLLRLITAPLNYIASR